MGHDLGVGACRGHGSTPIWHGRHLQRSGLAEDEYEACVEEQGPLRVVLRCSGAYEADVPMHHYAGYRPLRWITRIYAYAGHSFLRVVHTVVFTGTAREVSVRELGLRLPLSTGRSTRYTIDAGRRQVRDLQPNQYALRAERRRTLSASGCAGKGVEKRAEGERCSGWVMPEEGNSVGGRPPPHGRRIPQGAGGEHGRHRHLPMARSGRQMLRYARYAEEVAWHEGEGVYSDGLGSAKSSEFFLCFGSERNGVEDTLNATLNWPCVAIEREDDALPLLGNGTYSAQHSESERMLEGFVEWMERQIHRERWYGYLDWGDVLATWEEEADSWRFRGRWGWCNSEWDPRHAVWLHALRTGQRVFQPRRSHDASLP